MTSRPVILSLQGYPEKFMKTKERENISHPNPGSITGLRRPNATAPGGGPTLTSGSSIHSLQGYPEKFMKTKEREKFSRTTPGSIPGVRCPHAAAAGGAPTLTSSSSIHSLQGYPDKFMKTKEREKISRPTDGNIRGASVSERGGSRRSLDPHFQLLDSLLAGISREVHENKGAGKFHMAKPGGICQGSAIDDPISGRGGHLRARINSSTSCPCPLSSVAWPEPGTFPFVTYSSWRIDRKPRVL